MSREHKKLKESCKSHRIERTRNKDMKNKRFNDKSKVRRHSKDKKHRKSRKHSYSSSQEHQKHNKRSRSRSNEYRKRHKRERKESFLTSRYLQ